MKVLVTIALALVTLGCQDHSQVVNIIEAKKPCRTHLNKKNVDPRPHCYEVYPKKIKVKRCIARKIAKCETNKCIKKKVRKCLKRKAKRRL